MKFVKKKIDFRSHTQQQQQKEIKNLQHSNGL